MTSLMDTKTTRFLTNRCTMYPVHCLFTLETAFTFIVNDISYRKIKAIDSLLFASDITNSDLLKKPERSLDELVYQYRHVMRELLDKHAPSKTITLTVRPKAP